MMSAAQAQDSLNHSQRDVIDVLHSIVKINKLRSDTNTVFISALPAAGYSSATGFAVVLSAEAAFYVENKHSQHDKVSNIISSITYSQYNQIIFPIQTARLDRQSFNDSPKTC